MLNEDIKKKLQQRNIIKAKKSAGKTTLYSFNKNYEEWNNPKLFYRRRESLSSKILYNNVIHIVRGDFNEEG
jgi:hypothetical protein